MYKQTNKSLALSFHYSNLCNSFVNYLITSRQTNPQSERCIQQLMDRANIVQKMAIIVKR